MLERWHFCYRLILVRRNPDSEHFLQLKKVHQLSCVIITLKSGESFV